MLSDPYVAGDTHLPDGAYYGEDRTGNDCFGPADIAVRVRLRVEGDEMTLDFTGIDPQMGHLVTLGGLDLPNLEFHEQMYPVPYVRREQRCDNVGPGCRRGGTGGVGSEWVVPADTAGDDTVAKMLAAAADDIDELTFIAWVDSPAYLKPHQPKGHCPHNTARHLVGDWRFWLLAFSPSIIAHARIAHARRGV